MARLTRLTLVLALLGAPASLALAQGYGPPASATYDLRVLAERPGIIYVSPKYLTVIEFNDLIDEIGTSQPGLIQVKVSDSERIIFLKSLKQAGSADLVVRIGGYVALFRVVVDPKMDAPRRYVVTFSSAGGAPARPTVAPQGNAPFPEGPGGSGDLRGNDTSKPSSPKEEGEAVGKEPVQARFQPMRSGSGWVVYYEITNTGKESLTLRMADLVVTRGAVAIPFRLVRTAFGSDTETLEAGATAAGMIVVENSPEGVSWQWLLKSPTTSYTLRGEAP